MNQNTTAAASPDNSMSLRWWNVYFILKIILILQNIVKLSLLYNLAFIVFLLFPIHNKKLRILREIIAVGIAISLLYYDSYLPPVNNLLSQANQLANFEFSYLLELLGRFISFDFLLLVAIVCFVFYLANKIFRVTTFVILTLLYLSLPTISPTKLNLTVAASEVKQTTDQETSNSGLVATNNFDEASLDNYRQQFFKLEESKTSKLNFLTETDLNHANFDILVLSVCSVAWDDLELTGELDHPLLSEFDIRFDNYNSATSYSGPALIRLLRAGCGQQQHNSLFEPEKQNQCLLFEQLNSLGFNSELVLNHNAEFDDFSTLVKNNLPLNNVQPVPLQGLSPYIVSFDGSKIYRDLDILTAWSQTASQEKSVTLYNTISVHDGNKIIRSEGGSHLERYHEQQKNLLDDLYQFFKQLEASKRNIVVVFVPEHGASMRGDRMQIKGMREIPTPAITHVPVGIKLFGENIKLTGRNLIVNKNVSHLALSDVLANIISSGIYTGQEVSTTTLVDGIDEVQAVSENTGAIMMHVDSKNVLSLDGSEWIEYSP